MAAGTAILHHAPAAHKMELITGGTGIVGTHVLLERAVAGAAVKALYRRNSDRSIVDRVFHHYRPDADALLERIHWVEGDLHSIDALEEAMTGVQHVYHAAAMVSFDPRDAREMHRVNVEGTANVVNAALATGVQRICHVSSIAAIGEGTGDEERHEGMVRESDDRISAYALSKYEAEMEIHRGIAEGVEGVMVNPGLILGPGRSGRSSMTLIDRLRKGTRYHPPGANAFVDVRDVAELMVQVMHKAPSGGRYILVGENMSYARMFAEAATTFRNASPSHRLAPWMLELAWRVEKARTWITRTKPFVTRDTVQSALAERRYSNAASITLTGHAYRTVNEALTNVAAFLEGRPVY